jgi:hypothetical protein
MRFIRGYRKKGQPSPQKAAGTSFMRFEALKSMVFQIRVIDLGITKQNREFLPNQAVHLTSEGQG